MDFIALISSLEAVGVPAAQILAALKEAHLQKKEKTRVRVKKHREINKPVTHVTQNSVTGVTNDLFVTSPENKSLEINKPVTQNLLHAPSFFLSSPKSKEESKEERKESKSAEIQIPDWLPQADWNDYQEFRKKKKAPDTRRARELAISTLEDLRKAGNDPGKVLQQSIMRNWTGLFPVKGEYVNGATHHNARPQQQKPTARVITMKDLNHETST